MSQRHRISRAIIAATAVAVAIAGMLVFGAASAAKADQGPRLIEGMRRAEQRRTQAFERQQHGEHKMRRGHFGKGTAVPELDPRGLAGAGALLVGGALIVADRRRQRTTA
jgi:hypothetical protein